MKTIERDGLMPWILSSLDDMGGVDLSEIAFEFILKDRGPDESKLGADLKFVGPEVVTEFLVAAALYLSEDKGDSFLNALDKMETIPDDIDFELLRSGDVSMELKVDFSDINNPTVVSNNLSAEGFLVSFAYLALQYGEGMGEKVLGIIMRIAERLIKLNDAIKLDGLEKEAKK